MSGRPAPVRIRVLGSGTSVGVPTIGCSCKVCLSSDPRDKRLRPSILVRHAGGNVIIDATPDLRQQVLEARLDRLDAILLTHAHADHILGLDDVRPFNYHRRDPIPLYGSPETVDSVEHRFDYIFDGRQSQSSRPRLETRVLDGTAFVAGGLEFLPIPLLHGDETIYGFRFGAAAYLTDHSEIPETSLALLGGLDVLFLDALRYKPHPTHSTVERSLRYVERLAPRRAWFTHICHDLGHERAESMLPAHIRLAYDGLEVEVGGEA